MILVDSSIWSDHFRHREASLVAQLENDRVLCHPFIVGELACGFLPSRRSTLRLLRTLPEAPLLQHEEALLLIEQHRLMASGIGWIETHLLGSARLAGATLWTRDRALADAARKLGVFGDY